MNLRNRCPTSRGAVPVAWSQRPPAQALGRLLVSGTGQRFCFGLEGLGSGTCAVSAESPATSSRAGDWGPRGCVASCASVPGGPLPLPASRLALNAPVSFFQPKPSLLPSSRLRHFLLSLLTLYVPSGNSGSGFDLALLSQGRASSHLAT